MYVDKTSTLQGLLRFYIDRNQSILINEQNLHEMICCYVVLIYVRKYCVCTEGALRGHSTTTWTKFDPHPPSKGQKQTFHRYVPVDIGFYADIS